ncbi:MAG: glycosyltransferase family 4 protein [Syntrophomonadaceae bacterium]|nr:glycosyltransferase family 4 protein [Syntrophomonadaceae bacterium]
MIKILYIVSTLQRSGPINVLYNLISNLDRTVFEARMITLSPEEENSDIKKFKDLNVDIEQLNLTRLQGMLVGKRKIEKYISQYRPDIIHSHGLRPDIINSSITSECIKFCTVHNYAHEDYVMKYGFIKGKIMAHKHIASLKHIKYPIACSYSIKSLLYNHQIHAYSIQNGIDTKLYSNSNADYRTIIRQKYSIPQRAIVFISVGSLIERKNPLAVLDAFLGSSICNISYLIMVGTGSLKEKLQKRSQRFKNVIFTGHVDNVVDFLCASDYFISASRSEGLPMTVLEAMSCGLPVILSDIPQHNEILKHNKKAGKTFKTINNLTQIFNTINTNNQLSYNTMSHAATNLISEHLSAEVMSKHYQDIYISSVSSLNVK